MQTSLTPILAQAVQADIARDAAVARPVRRALRDRLRARRTRSQQLVPAPVRIQRPATW